MHNEIYKEGNESAILHLFQQAFNKPLPFEFWEWRFRKNPFLEQPMINLTWDEDILAGHYAVSAGELMINGKQHLTSLSGTTMTHPQYQGKGIFTSLALDLYSRIAEDYGVNAVLGFPNKNSHYGLVKKIGWKDVSIIPTLTAATSGMPVTDNRLSVISAFTKEHEAFALDQINSSGFSVFVNRSAEYLNWRYIQNPVNNYTCLDLRAEGKLHGFIVVKEFTSFTHAGETELDILEFFCDAEKPVVAQLVYGALACFVRENNTPSRMNAWLSVLDAKHLIIELLGFNPTLPLTYMCTKAFTPGLESIGNFSNWYFSMGDSDIY